MRLTNDSDYFADLLSKCPSCGDVECFSVSGLGWLDFDVINATMKRSDAWIILCDAFRASDVKLIVENNSEDTSVRCIDVIYHLYHRNPNLTWNMIIKKVGNIDPHLAKVIEHERTIQDRDEKTCLLC